MKPHLENALVGYGSGFHFTVPPPPKVASRRNLLSSDPYEVLSCVLANLQVGEFDVAEALLPLVESTDDVIVLSSAANLVCYAGPDDCVHAFFNALVTHTEETAWFEACSAALNAGMLWAVRPSLEVYARLADPILKSNLSSDLSWLLEEEPGAIFSGPGALADTEHSPYEYGEDERLLQRYRELVLARLHTVVSFVSGDSANIVESEPLDHVRVATRLLERVKTAGAVRARIEQGWMLFSAFSGLDCREFFTPDGRLRTLSAAAIIEGFLQSQPATYRLGRRYFFGHEVPSRTPTAA